MIKESKIANKQNDDFYENTSPFDMEVFSEKGGIANFCDIKKIFDYIKDAKSILEVGAGYGRVVDGLLHYSFLGKITAIEKSKTLFEFLKKKYKRNSKLSFLRKDILNEEKLNEKFDAILFLWSGIQDFSPDEQELVLINLKALLNKSGMLIIDSIPEDVHPLESNQVKDYDMHKLTFKGNSVYIHKVSAESISSFGKKLGFKKTLQLPYVTETKRNRIVHILYL